MLQETGGEYGIALNERHFEELVFSHATPPPSLASDTHASLVRPAQHHVKLHCSDAVVLLPCNATAFHGEHSRHLTLSCLCALYAEEHIDPHTFELKFTVAHEG